MNFLCPYCNGALPPPTRKRLCSHCHRTIFARSRPNQSKRWVKEEDLPFIAREWAEEWLKKDNEHFQGIKQAAEENLKTWKSSGVVKTFKIYSCKDNFVCPACVGWNNVVIKISDAVIGRTLPPFDFCQNNKRNAKCNCRCFSRPEDISID